MSAMKPRAHACPDIARFHDGGPMSGPISSNTSRRRA
jgi:hypothetical protein